MIEPAISICIPTYDANGAGPLVLSRLLQSIEEQSFKDYEVIISNHSALLDVEASGYKILAYTEHQGSSAYNTNNAIQHAKGKYIKIMNHDDFFHHENVLRDMHHALENSEKQWSICQCVHTDANETQLYNHHTPSWPGEKGMVEAVNRLGCPSVLMYEASLDVRFDTDPDILYAMDCDLYIQLFRKAGEPLRHNDIGVVIRMWDQQLSNQVNIAQEIERGKAYMRNKYGYE